MINDPLPELRIAMVIDLFPPIVGGAETHARDLAGALCQLGARVAVFTRKAREELPEREILPTGVEVIRLGCPGDPRWGKYRFIPTLVREWCRRAADFDVVYLCGFRVLGWPLVRTVQRTGVPVVLRAEVCGEMSGDFVWNRPGRGESRVLRFLFRPVIRWRNRRLIKGGYFLSISGVITEEYEREGVPNARIHKIPNGIDTDRFSPARAGEKEKIREKLGLPDGLVFVYSGKLNRGKGLPSLLSSWNHYVASGSKGVLVLVGSGKGQFLSEEEQLIRWVKDRHLEDRVRFTGYRQDVEQWLRAADVFVFPSEAESFGLAPLEANACAIPVICTPAGALAETVPDGIGGLRVAVGDEEAMMDAMRKMALDSELRSLMGKRGRDRVVCEYSFKAIAQRHIDWFSDLAKEAET